MGAAVPLLDPRATPSATASFTAFRRAAKVESCTNLHSSGTPQGMWPRASVSKAQRFTGRMLYKACQ